MVDPDQITRYDRNDWELQEFLLFSVAVAGKTAKTIAPRVDAFLKRITDDGEHTPFDSIRGLDVAGFDIAGMINQAGIGCHTQKARTFIELSNDQDLNLYTCTPYDLERYYGIGPKTARLFVMHTRENERYAALDTHILKFLREEGVENVPASTPPAGSTYNRLEQEFLKLVPPGMTPADFDLEVWKRYRK